MWRTCGGSSRGRIGAWSCWVWMRRRGRWRRRRGSGELGRSKRSWGKRAMIKQREWRREWCSSEWGQEGADEPRRDLLRANPKQPEALYYRGVCLYFLGNHPQAIAHAQEALRSDPDFILARFVLLPSRRAAPADLAHAEHSSEKSSSSTRSRTPATSSSRRTRCRTRSTSTAKVSKSTPRTTQSAPPS